MVFGDIICCVVFVGEAIYCVPMRIHCVSMRIHSTNQQSHNTSKPLMLMEPLNALPTETRTPDLSLSWLLVPITETVGQVKRFVLDELSFEAILSSPSSVWIV